MQIMSEQIHKRTRVSQRMEKIQRVGQMSFTDKEADLINDKLNIQYYRYKSKTNPQKLFIEELMKKVNKMRK